MRKGLEDYDRRQTDPESKSADSQPNNYLQWTINAAKISGTPKDLDPKTIAGRVLLMQFAAIHTSSFAITHAILDLLSSKQEYLDELREEVTSAMNECGGQMTKQALAKMVKLDSFFRESARMNSFVSMGIFRRVVAKEDLTTPQGVHLPRGSVLAVPAYTTMNDPTTYADPQTFRPFRFVAQGGDDSADIIKEKRQAYATTSPDFLAFGHGRHACPGRFFAASEMKLMVGYMLQNCDFELHADRPKNGWIGITRIPPVKARIKVKRSAAK